MRFAEFHRLTTEYKSKLNDLDILTQKRETVEEERMPSDGFLNCVIIAIFC